MQFGPDRPDLTTGSEGGKDTFGYFLGVGHAELRCIEMGIDILIFLGLYGCIERGLDIFWGSAVMNCAVLKGE